VYVGENFKIIGIFCIRTYRSQIKLCWLVNHTNTSKETISWNWRKKRYEVPIRTRAGTKRWGNKWL